MNPTEIPMIISPNHTWLLATAATALIISLAQAWAVSLIYYMNVKVLRDIFPSPHQLIRSHVDYCIMAGLLGLFFVSTQALLITLPDIIIVLICVGALYNPAPFILLAMKSDAKEARKEISRAGGLAICVGFLPVTIGFGYTVFAVLSRILFHASV